MKPWLHSYQQVKKGQLCLNIKFVAIFSRFSPPHIVATDNRETSFFLLAPNTYSVDVFTLDFCAKLMEEVRNFEKSDVPKGRPNTMNKGGVSYSRFLYLDANCCLTLGAVI